jgi:hypothetical protein
VALLACASGSRAAYTPIAIQSSSFNADVVVESNATPTLMVVTSASVDNGTNNTANTWFEMGYDTNNPANGLPVHGSTFSAADAADHSYTMAPSYTAPNGILIDSVVTNGAFTPITPAAYTKLSFLGSGGNGGDGISVIVQHADGTSETGSFGCPDWFGGSGVAAIVGGRCNSTVNLTTEVDGTSGDGRGNPRIYYRDVTLTDTTSPVTNIILHYASGQASSHNDIMGVSGALTSGTGAVTPILVTGYDYDFVVEATAPRDGRVLSQTIVNSTNVWATSDSLDSETNSGTSFYEEGYNINNADSGSWNNPSQNLTGTGIPHPGTYLTNATGDHIYQMPPSYTANDAIYIGLTLTNDTITLTTPTAYTGLSFLGSAGSGPVSVFCIVNHTGGKSETNILTVNDWFNSSAAYAWIANGRVAVDTAQFSNISSGNPRLLENDIVLSDTTDPVVSITLLNTNTTGGRIAILAISGSAGALPPAIVAQPASVNAYWGSSVTFTSTATANAPLTYQWQVEGTNGVFTNLVNSGNISGVTSTVLTINPIVFTNQANYQLVASDSAGFAISGAAALMVFSTNTDVTQPGDPISVGPNVFPFGDGAPATAIDNSMSTKFGANFNSGTVPYLVVTPTAGRTILNGLRIYTGSDTVDRDPTAYELDGSLNGGATYTLISSNAIALTDNRNSGTGSTPDPLTQYVTEVRFANTNGYTTYRLQIPATKGGSVSSYTQVQFEEMELLGVVDTSQPYFNEEPTDQRVFVGNAAYFSAAATFNPTPTLSWFRGTNGVYVPLTNGGNISGVQSESLAVNPVNFVDAADYIAVANYGSGYVTSSIAHLYAFSTNVDVTVPTDPITGFGDTTGSRYTNSPPAYAIDNDMNEYENGGSGLNASAGFPPFAGPVGVIITPAVGSTILAGVRFYPGQDPAANDPASYILEGSNDGSTYTTIDSGPLALPAARNAQADDTDPTQVSSVQEILFSNTRAYTSYRVTFPTVVSPNSASYLEIGDLELLGVPGTSIPQPVIGHATLKSGSLQIVGSGGTPSGSFVVQTNANLTISSGWNTAATGSYDASGNFSITLPVSTTTPELFYRLH